MADIAPDDRLQPCLLDRLTDDRPRERQPEPRQMRMISLARYREAVLRDVRWLFNNPKPRPEDGLAEFPEVERSVLNYGVRDFAGMFSEGKDPADIEREIREALAVFEPRILRHTLRVRVFRADSTDPERNPHRIGIEIGGHLWSQPYTTEFNAKTEIDLETGDCVFS